MVFALVVVNHSVHYISVLITVLICLVRDIFADIGNLKDPSFIQNISTLSIPATLHLNVTDPQISTELLEGWLRKKSEG